MYQIGFIPENNLDSILPLLVLLNEDTAEEIIRQRLSEIKKTDYGCVGVYDGAKLIAISGVWILHKIYAGKHIEPDNVVVHPDYRSKGVGELLVNWIHDYARSIGCMTSELNTRINNEKGIRFWKRMGYQNDGYHFIKVLTENKIGGNN
jgi:GNAT superfamily N-acetyltransferase